MLGVPVRRVSVSRLVAGVFVTVLALLAALVSPAAAVGPVETCTTLTVTPADPEYGGTVSLEAEVVTLGDATPVTSGTVVFSAIVVPLGPGVPPPPVLLGEAPLDGTGVATLGDVPVGAGGALDLAEGQVFLVMAAYSGVPDAYVASASDPASVTPTLGGSGGPEPEPEPTSTAVTGPDEATVGTPVELAATVDPHEAAGTVQFSVDHVSVGDPVAVLDGEAVLTYSFVTAGDKTVGATFVPADSAAYTGSTDLVGRQVTVADPDPVATPTTTTVTGPASATAGTPVTLTATVSPTAAGTVQFSVDGSPVGSPADVASGVATLSHSFASTGPHHVRAAFTPSDPVAFGSSSDTTGLDVTVSAPPPTTTTTTVTGPASATAGVPVTLTATVSPSSAVGTVQFSVDGSPVGSPVAVASGSASLSHTFAGAGSRTVRATFAPTDPDAFESSSDSTGLAVSVASPPPPPPPPPTATATNVTGPRSTHVGSLVTYVAHVSPVAAAGTVQLSVDGVVTGAPAPLSDGVALLAYTAATAGEHLLEATFVPADSGAWSGSAAPAWRVTSSFVTTTVVTGPTAATVGSPATLVARVTPDNAEGTVQFLVDDLPVGSATRAEQQDASLSYTFTTAGAHTVRAAFTPLQSTSYEASEDSVGLSLSVAAIETSVTVTGPAGATAGEETTLAASVQPEGAAGQMTFVVGGSKVTTVDVEAGVASTTYTFASAGDSEVVATFEPADPDTYRSSSTSRTVHVAAGTSAEASSDEVSTVYPSMDVDNHCGRSTRSVGPVGAGRDPSSPFSPFEYINGVVKFVATIDYNFLAFVDDPFQHVASTIRLRFKVGPCGVITDGRFGPAEPLRGEVQCLLTDSGYQCPLYLEAFSSLRLRFAVPMPAALAGHREKLKPSLSYVDPVTGGTQTLKGAPTTVKVPARTVLSARLAPAMGGVSSVPRGHALAYRLLVRNGGILPAHHVHACVTIGRGSEIRAANHAEVRGRRACWTLPTMKKRGAVARSLVLVAPHEAGDLRLAAVVRPRKSEASPVHLRTMLPVR